MRYANLITILGLTLLTQNYAYAAGQPDNQTSLVNLPTAQQTVERLRTYIENESRALERNIAEVLYEARSLPIKIEVREYNTASVAIAMAAAEGKGYLVELAYGHDGQCQEMTITTEVPQMEFNQVNAKLVR
jgi:hypothetical protein